MDVTFRSPEKPHSVFTEKRGTTWGLCR